MKDKYRVLVDTNFFFIPFYENYDSLLELSKILDSMDISIEGFYTLKKNVWEIENKLRTSKSYKWKKIYRLALDYIKTRNVRVLESPINEKTDRLMLNVVLSGNYKWIVATQDKNLRFILKKLKIPYAYYSKKSIKVKIF